MYSPYYTECSITDRPVGLNLFLGMRGRGRVLGMIVGLGGVQPPLLGPSGGGTRCTLHQAHGDGHGHPGVATRPHNSHQIENLAENWVGLIPTVAIHQDDVHVDLDLKR